MCTDILMHNKFCYENQPNFFLRDLNRIFQGRQLMRRFISLQGFNHIA